MAKVREAVSLSEAAGAAYGRDFNRGSAPGHLEVA
jgi:hypothetical protein